MESQVLVLYPYPAMGHLISMVELGKLILADNPSLSITVLTTPFPYSSAGSTASYISAVASTVPSITFHRLPPVSLPQQPSSYPSRLHLTFDIIRLNNPNVRLALRSLSLTSNIPAVILDLFCSPAFSIAASDLRIPTYYFFTSGASCLAFYLRFPLIHRSTTESFSDLPGTYFQVPGIQSPIPAVAVPEPMHDRHGRLCKDFLEFTSVMPMADGIIVNSFPSLEPKAVEVLLEEKICIGEIATPAVYCIGPLFAPHDRESGGDRHECLRWLDAQPTRSVVFLCFGSSGVFSKEQLMEIAAGLEGTGLRFLWAIRSPPNVDDKAKRYLPPPDPDLDSLLPEGFLDRTRERGMVVKTWAPQVAVLNHEAVGGFVTHCGWNSILEAVYGGVPMVAWPLYAEQRFNRIVLVEEMKVAVAVEISETGFVSSGEVEKRVKEVMESEEGDGLREKVSLMRDEAKAALSHGGSAHVALAKLIDSWRGT